MTDETNLPPAENIDPSSVDTETGASTDVPVQDIPTGDPCDPSPPDPGTPPTDPGAPPDPPSPPEPTPAPEPPPEPVPEPVPAPPAPPTVVAPTPLYSFVLIDLTTSVTPTNLAPAPVFQQLIDAWSEQITGPFAKEYGLVPVSFRIGASPGDRQPGENAINFRDNIPEAPGALAFHQVVNGVPDIEIGCDLFETLLVGSESLSVGGSHELLELLRDDGANGWKDKQDGSNLTGAEEVVDPVQNTFYPASNGVHVTNFVLRSYFIPGAPGPWDKLGVMQSKTDLSNGYEIQATAPSDIKQTMGDASWALRGSHAKGNKVTFIAGQVPTGRARKRKAHPYSRTYRRGVRL